MLFREAIKEIIQETLVNKVKDLALKTDIGALHAYKKMQADYDSYYCDLISKCLLKVEEDLEIPKKILKQIFIEDNNNLDILYEYVLKSNDRLKEFNLEEYVEQYLGRYGEIISSVHQYLFLEIDHYLDINIEPMALFLRVKKNRVCC